MAIKGKIKIVLATFAVAAASVFSLVSPVSADSAKVLCSNGKYAEDFSKCSGAGDNQKRDVMSTLNTVINVLLGVIGFIAVIMIILGGINYTTSQGDATKVKKAKDTILYGIIGLVVALLAYALVNFVLANVFNNA